MRTAAPTFSQIKAQIAAIRKKVPDASVFGIRTHGGWTGQKEKRDGDQSYMIYQCDSPLAIRLALREETAPGTMKVLITSIDETELSDDIRLRIAKRRFYDIDSWQIVAALFQATTIDPRLMRYPWIAEALLDLSSTESFPPARGGFLDADTVWALLLSRIAGFASETLDSIGLLKWASDADAVGRFQQASEPFRQGAVEWVRERTGSLGELILDCAGRLERPDALPLGLAAGVVFHPQAAGQLERAAGKLEERYLAGKSTDPAAMLRWGSAAAEVVLRHIDDPRARWQQLQRADEILREVQAEAFAFLSDTSPLGFDQRLGRFGRELSVIVRGKEWKKLDELRKIHDSIQNHDQAEREHRRLERVEMGMRLLRWLGDRAEGRPGEPESLAEVAAREMSDTGYVDWARLTLRAGDPVRELSEAYASLFAEVTSLRERHALEFAKLLCDWTAAGSRGDEVVPVENILDQYVAPLAAQCPVLLIVVDAMSVAVARELTADLLRHEWISLCEPGRAFNRPAIAAIPSVTEISRMSLLSGRVRMGVAADEKSAFGSHPGLLARCRAGCPPALFHKPSLQDSDDAILSTEVREEIASTNRRVVAVVVNAVDDHLLKGEQIDTRWSRDEIKVLPSLLHEARNAGRIVVLVSDHGHVLDCQTEARVHEGGERWRKDDGKPAPDELRIEGGRVLVENSRLIAPWSERVRYGIKKNGYHGGLNPQEMVVPVIVLVSGGNVPPGWTEAPVETPGWWEQMLIAETCPEQPLPLLKAVEPRSRQTLFDMEPECESTQVTAQPQEFPEWVSRLLSSPVFAAQKKLGGRAVPGDEVFARFLAALDRRGGKMTSAALARTTSFPLLRLQGLLAVMQRVLNIDGYAVLSRDEASDTVILNRDLLLKQFDLV
ncbi:MAG: BREX-2 system phosphatase PglZ [Acidobacteriia bacterium]|nr:BREX-2 system phosphatase PglZ [Terriglobia bacterium]